MGAHPFLCKQTWLSPLKSMLFVWLHLQPTDSPASLYQHSSTTKRTTKPKLIPSPSNQLEAQWMPQLLLSRLPVTRLLSQFDFWVFCVTVEKGFHHHCIGCMASLTWVLHPHCSADTQETHACVVWQQTTGQHQHLVKSKLSYPYNVIWIVLEVWSLKPCHPLSNK